MLKIVLVGLGAISQALIPLLQAQPGLQLLGLLVREGGAGKARALLSGLQAAGQPTLQVAQALSDLPGAGLLVECAGHAAVAQHVLPALAAGIPCVMASVGALAEPDLAGRLEAAARVGGSRLQLVAGAIGAIDALAAARLGGLGAVVYTGSKPALAWRGTPADRQHDLAALRAPTLIFDGSARQAALAYPQNANVAATLALAGLGLDATRVQLVADPHSHANTHHVKASGAFGEFELTMRGQPLAGNPKTSVLTVYSLLRAVLNHTSPIVI